MKRKTTWIIALIAIPLVAAVFILHAQTTDDEEAEMARWEAFIADQQKTLDATEFDLQFTITDTDGKPLDGVSVEIEQDRPVLQQLLSGKRETKKEKKTVDSRFRIQAKGWPSLELTFMKDGYYIETRRYHINFMPNDSRDLGPDGKPKLVMKEDIQVVMYKGVPAGDLTGTRGTLRYDFEKGTRSIFDLSAFDKKTEKPKKTTVSEEDGEEEEEDHEEEYAEERIRIEMKSVDLKAKPKASKYIELDFRRDENGEILFDGMLRDTPCPASFIIRLHSDDPGDGFIPVDKPGPGFVRKKEYDKRYPTAPETGYKKELVLDFGKKDADGKFPYETNYLFTFVKCGQRYGTVFFHPIVIDGGPNKTIRQIRLGVESLTMNRTADDRNVSEGSFYVERERPAQTRNDLKETDAKNEAENAPEDKAETAKKWIGLLNEALNVYRLDTGKYPSTLHCLEKNIDDDPRWDGPYIKPNVPLDPWGNEYRYSVDETGKSYRLTSSGLAEAGTGEQKDPPETEQEKNAGTGDRKEPDIFAGLPLWNTEQDGQPETWLRDLVNDAAKRAEVNLQSLGDVRITPIDAEHSYADLNLDVVDEYGKVVRFIEEIGKKTPRLGWHRLELRVNSARERIAAELQDTPSVAASAKAIRMIGRIRVIAYTPVAAPSAPAKEKRNDDIPITPGETDILTMLYDLSVSLPDDALVTDFRLLIGKSCEFTIQTRESSPDLSRFQRFPAWRLGRLVRRAISDNVYSFTVGLGKKDNPEPRKDRVTPNKKIATIVARNIFDPEAACGSSARPVSDGTRPDTPADPAADLERQLDESLKTRAELDSLLQTLQHRSAVSKGQINLVRQRLERAEQIEALREQQKNLRP